MPAPSSSASRVDRDDLGVAVDLLDRRLEADVDEPLARVLERQLAALGELLGDALDPERRDAGEEAGGALGDREVGDVAEVAVELCRLRCLGGGCGVLGVAGALLATRSS